MLIFMWICSSYIHCQSIWLDALKSTLGIIIRFGVPPSYAHDTVNSRTLSFYICPPLMRIFVQCHCCAFYTILLKRETEDDVDRMTRCGCLLGSRSLWKQHCEHVCKVYNIYSPLYALYCHEKMISIFFEFMINAVMTPIDNKAYCYFLMVQNWLE